MAGLVRSGWTPPPSDQQRARAGAQVESKVDFGREFDKDVQVQRDPDSGGSFATAHGSWAG
eukprot:9899621-Heterocapsa_arctica.AAC.1